MSEYDKELDSRTDEYEDAMKPKRRTDEEREENADLPAEEETSKE